MKIIYLANNRIPTEKAHGVQIMEMCRAFSEIAEIELVVPRRKNNIKQGAFEYYGIPGKFKIKTLPCIDAIAWNIGNLGLWIETLSFLISARIFLLFKKYDLLYTREKFAGFFFKNFAIEVHGLPQKIKSMHKFLWSRAAALIVKTGYYGEKLTQAGIKESRILVMPNGVNLEFFNVRANKAEARKELNLPAGDKLVGYVGMLRSVGVEKGMDFAIKSLKHLPESAKLVVIGGHAEDIEFYKKYAAGEGLEKRVIFVGRVPHDSVPLYLRALDMVIAPFPRDSHYDFFMSPLKIFEYMASGKPIVTTDLPAIRVLLNDSMAILVEPGSERALADGINKILGNEKLGEDLARQAYQEVQGYTWSEEAKKILNFTSAFL